MKLHYSQTCSGTVSYSSKFYYLMKLHYSQTKEEQSNDYRRFYYLMKLHYSQTNKPFLQSRAVLLPYEITLLSNQKRHSRGHIKVLLPYEITLLSNGVTGTIGAGLGFTTL